MESEKCPCCPNHCDKENLSCGRGEEYFHGTKKTREEKPNSIEEAIILDLRKCGHMLHHNHDLNPNDLLKNFSKEELEQLHSLLAKICEE